MVMFKVTVPFFRSLGCWSSRSLHPPAMTWLQWGITPTKCYVYWQRSDLPRTRRVVPACCQWAPFWRWWSQRIFWSTCFSGISAEAWTLTARGHYSSCLRCSLASHSNLSCSTQPSSTRCWGCWEPVLTQNLVVLQRWKTAWYCCSIRYMNLLSIHCSMCIQSYTVYIRTWSSSHTKTQISYNVLTVRQVLMVRKEHMWKSLNLRRKFVLQEVYIPQLSAMCRKRPKERK